MQIRVESNDFDEVSRCGVCEKVFHVNEVVARAYDASETHLADVCPECIASGAGGISHRLQRQANALRLKAAMLEQLARSEIKCPSLAEFRVMSQLVKTFL